MDDHELYCAGHLFEAAVTAKENLGDDRLLQFASRYTDYIYDRFVVKQDTGFKVPGHEEIELALFRLYGLTKDEKYKTLAAHFLNLRGTDNNQFTDLQRQTHLPIREQTEAEGHAVRALYLYTAMADMAKDLRKYADAKKFNAKADDIKAAIVKEFVNEETGEVDNNSQTSLACVIFHNLVSRKVGKKIARRLAASVKKAGYHYYAGVLGCKYIFSALSEYGYTDVAYKAIVNPDYPSYANWIARGATTMWEDWNDGFSRNHHMYSDVIGWMYKYLAGIKTDEKNPGYRRFFVEPKVIDDLSYVQAETESPFGKIVAGWKKENGTLTVTVTVPYGTTAVLTMPDGAKKELAAGTYTETCSL
jgi:hypothetical protein